jgi:predicted MFS family arabinose efflux permease
MNFSSTVRPLAALYIGTFLSGAWAMIIPTIPVIAREFDISAGGAAQIVTAFAIGKFIGTVIGGDSARSNRNARGANFRAISS